MCVYIYIYIFMKLWQETTTQHAEAMKPGDETRDRNKDARHLSKVCTIFQ